MLLRLRDRKHIGDRFRHEYVIVPLALGCLPSTDGRTLVDRLGREALERGGGNAARIDPLPPGVRRGSNDDAFIRGVRLWEEVVEPHDRRPSLTWRVVR